jgi:thiol-disulfide isomerase/thioredoxin
MFERLLLTMIVALLGMVAFTTIRYWHMRRASKATATDLTPVDRPTLLYFRSDSCAPCVTQAHYLQALEGRYGSRVTIHKVDADLEPELASRYGIFTLPTTLIVDRSGEVRHINYGLTATKKLAQQLEKVK